MTLFDRRHDSPFARLDVRLKLGVGLSVSLLVVLVDSAAALGALGTCGLVCFFAARPSLAQLKLVLLISALLVWGVVVSQGLFYAKFPRRAILTIAEPNAIFPDGLKVYAEGLQYGLLQSLRMVAVGMVGYAICFSTDPDRFLRGMLALRIPYGLAFMAVTAIRFLPTLADEVRTVRTAMRMKGYRPFHLGIRATLRTELAALRPILARAVRRSEEVALSMLTRGFSPGVRRQRKNVPLGWSEILGLTSLAAIVLLVAAAKVLFWLYQQEVYFHASLRTLYALVRQWL